MRIALPSLRSYSRDTRLLFVITLIYSLAFFGINMLIKRLFLLRLGYPASFLGVFNAVAAFAYMSTGLPAGELGRRIGPRPMLWLGIASTLLGFGLLPLAVVADQGGQKACLLGGQVFLAMGWSSINVSLMTALSLTSDDRSRAGTYAMYNALIGLGTLFGNLVGGVMPSWFSCLTGRPEAEPVNYAWTLVVAFCLVLLAIPPLLRLGPMRALDETDESSSASPAIKLPWPLIASLGVMVMLTQGSAGALASYGAAYMDTVLFMSVGVIGAVMALGKLVGVGVSLICPWLMRWFGAGSTIVMAGLALTLSVVPVVLTQHWLGASLSILLYLIALSLWSPAMVSYEMDAVPADWRSVMSGTHAMSMGMLHSLFNLGVAGIIDEVGYVPIFMLGGGLSLLGTLLMMGIRRVRERPAAARA